jgi:hypothetical protein
MSISPIIVVICLSILPIPNPYSFSHDNDRAWVQKERLLRFDREFARRTEIFDDQADYRGPSTWMDAEERQVAEEKQTKQLEKLKRPKQLLNLVI